MAHIWGAKVLTKNQAMELLEELVEEIDYDLYKDTFVEQCMEDPQESRARQKSLLKVLGKHVLVEDTSK